jgi:tripeptidyl-peptidase-1
MAAESSSRSQQFLELLRPDMDPSESFTVLSLDGGIDPQNVSEAGGEANLDIQYTAGLFVVLF